MVGIRSVLSTVAFQKTDKELPVALGKTISNEVLVIDLAKIAALAGGRRNRPGKISGLKRDPHFAALQASPEPAQVRPG